MTREEAINHLKDVLAEATETEDAVCYVTNGDAEALEMAIEALKFQEVYNVTIKAVNKHCDEHHTQILDWIPVSERLPNEKENVLVTDDDGTIYIAYYTTICDEPYWTWAGWSLHPKAWMHLPTPFFEPTPQEGEKDD